MSNMTRSLADDCSLDILFSCSTTNVEQEGTPAIYHPGDTVSGFLRIYTRENIVLDYISVTLEGVVRVWEIPEAGAKDLTAVQYRFLRQAQPLAYTTGQKLQITAGEYHMIPFSFKLPRYVPFPDAPSEQLLRLPPSLFAGEARFDPCGRVCMQPYIEYSVQSLVTAPLLGCARKARLQQSRSFVLIPFTDLVPPVEQGDFPGEFRPSSGAKLRKRRFALSVGELDIAMDEPSPLRVLDRGDKTCGKAWLKLAFRPSRTTLGQATQERREFIIESQIRVKTFYSTMPLCEMASTRLIRTNRHLHVRSHLIDLKRRKANLLLQDFAGEPTRGDCPSPRHPTDSSRLLVPIEVTENLVPTFCSLFAARRYSLRVALSIKGFSHQSMAVEVPLQVCYYDSTEIQTHDKYEDVENVPHASALNESTRVMKIDEDGSIGALPHYGL